MPDHVRILVVEDESPIRKFLRISLESNGFAMQEAETAEQGLRMASAEPPDAVILDLGLPDADGLDVERPHDDSAATHPKARSQREVRSPTT